MLAVLVAVITTLWALALTILVIWKITPEMPPLKYFFGFETEMIDYGDLQKSVIYYKVIGREVSMEPRGRRLEVAEYILRDKKYRWSKFYLYVRTVNGEVSFIAANAWESSSPESKLRCVLTYCQLPEEFDLFYKERCLQKVMDQIQYRPLDIVKV